MRTMQGRRRMPPHSPGNNLPWASAVVVVGMAMTICGGALQIAQAHQFAIQNLLSDPVLVECHSKYRSNGEQQLQSGRRYVVSWFEKSNKHEDWVCGFSWLGTTSVKQFFVWNHTCDNCEWRVYSTGFFLRDVAAQKDFHFVLDWDTSCLSAASPDNPTNDVSLSF